MPELATYTPLTDQVLRCPTHKVYMRVHWQSEWEEVQHCYAVGDVAWQIPPNFCTATLEWQYGVATRPQQVTQEAVVPFHPSNMVGRYIKIEWDSTDVPGEDDDDVKLPVFYGRVIGVVDAWGGDGAWDGEARARGVQRFTVHGIESLLDMTPIMSSHVMTLDDEDQQQVIEIGRTLDFNKINAGAIDHRMRLEGNMTSSPVDDGEIRCFDGSGGSPSEDDAAFFDPPEPWTLARIIDYLIFYHAPKDVNGDKIVKFSVRRNECFYGLVQHELAVSDYENLTVFRLLNQIIDRRRGLGWRLEPIEKEIDGSEGATETTFEIVLFAFVAEETELPVGGELRPDEDRIFDLDLSADHLAQVVVHTDGHLAYDQVIARGARRGSIINISNHSDAGDARIPIEEDWSTADDDALAEDWATGMEDIPGYKDLFLEQQKAARDRYRRLHKFERLWSYYRIAKDWDGLNAGDQPVFPELDDQGEPTGEPEKLWLPGLRLSHTLPLVVGVDYSGNRIANQEDNEAESILADLKSLPPDAHPEYLPMMAYLYFDNNGELAWRPSNMLGMVDGIAGGWPYTVSCTPQDSNPGVILKVRGGIRVTQRMLSGLGAADKDDGVAQEFTIDAKARVLVVAYAQQDQYVEHRIPADKDVEGHDGEAPDVIRRMVVSLPDCYLDWVPPYTVVGHYLWKDGESATDLVSYKLASTTEGAWLRDDRDRLETAAKLAAEWYLVTRKPITIQWRRLRRMLHVGDFITTLKQSAREGDDDHFELEVNTPVTSVRYDLDNGTTTVQTAFAELDVRGVSR